MIIKNGDHGFLYPSPRQCSGHMRRALDSKYWITFLCTEVSNQKDGYLTGLHTLIGIFYFTLLSMGYIKNLEEKDGQRQLLYYVSLIRACNKVLYQLVYIGKKFVFLKKNLGI